MPETSALQTLAASSLELQTTTTNAILFFGVAQLFIGLWVAIHAWRSAKSQKDARVTALAFHQSTMTALNDRRDDAERQHQEVMAALKTEREQSQLQHREVMAKWDRMNPQNLPSAEDIAQETAGKMVEGSEFALFGKGKHEPEH